MVGVAGKSKGCATCRRRKIKCDLAKPGCDKCKKAKIDCEGYERFPVFINRTKSGVQKRKPLEEAKVTNINLSTKDIAVDDNCDVVSIVRKPTTIFEISDHSLNASRINAWFFETFLRPSSRAKCIVKSPTHWLNYVLDLSSPAPALRDALLAVSTTRLASVNNNASLMAEGRRLYTRSLNLLQRALDDDVLALHDDTLATTSIMVLYELYDSSDRDRKGYINHLRGLARLLEHRGPQLHNTARSRAILEHCRYLIMMRSLFLRQASSLGSISWLISPWQETSKSIEQKVFDHGFILAGLFERHDKLAVSPASSIAEEAIAIVTECIRCQESLRALHNELQALSASNQTVSMADSGVDKLETDFIASHLAGSDGDEHYELVLAITALGIQLSFCATASATYDTYLSPGSSLLAEALQKAAYDLVSPMKAKLVVLARRIVRLVALYASLKKGTTGVARLMFALRYACEQLPPDDPEFVRCQELMLGMGGEGWKLGALQKVQYNKREPSFPCPKTDQIRVQGAQGTR